MSITSIFDCVAYLESDKITERKKSCARLSQILENQNIIVTLNKDGNCKNLIYSLQTCMRKDADKAIEDAKKKSTSVSSTNSLAPDLLIQVIKLALKEGIDIKICELVGYILGCMNDYRMKTCYEQEFMIILQQSILSNPKCRAQLTKGDWLEIYRLLKGLVQQNCDSFIISNSFMLLIKWGPLSGLSINILKDDFDFLTKYCLKVKSSSARCFQEDVLEIALNLCEHTAKDNRISCCKFGEDVCFSFINLYELNGRPEKTKELTIEFLLLQMVIHHPNITENDKNDYVQDLDTWKDILRSVFGLLNKEIKLYFSCNQKNTSFFKDVRGKVKLCDNFTKLFVEIFSQIYKYSLDFSLSLDSFSVSFDSITPPQKRRKTDLKLSNYIEFIQNTKKWLWVHLVGSIIETYPDLIGIKDYVYLLQVLSSIQIENNEFNVNEYLYICLSTMLSVEKLLDTSCHQEEITRLWELIGANTARAFGLNQHKEATEKLLEQLISKGIIDFEGLLQPYQSGLISLSLQTIKTFDSGLRFMVLNDLQKKELIMRAILPTQNIKDCKYLCSKETAKFLTKLAFKQYVSEEMHDDIVKVNSKYDSLKAIYSKILLDENKSTENHGQTEATPSLPDVDFESRDLLTKITLEFVDNNTETEEVLFSKIILLINIISCIIEYNVYSEEDIDNSRYMELLESLLNKPDIKEFSLSTVKDERDIKRLTECLKIVEILFSLKISNIVMDKLKDLIPEEFLLVLFNVLVHLDEDGTIDFKLYSHLKVQVAKTLSKFAFVCGNVLNTKQKNILECLTKTEYNYKVEKEYIVFKAFSEGLKFAQKGMLPNSILDNILACVRDLAAVLYHEKAEDILEMLCDLYPHMFASDNKNLTTSICFLKPFYQMIQNSGPNVALLLLDCIQELCKLDPSNNVCQWSDVELIKCVPDFLESDYFEIRSKAADVLVTFFKINTSSNDIRDIHRQEEILMKIYEKSLAVFEVSGNISKERRTDEALCRIATVSLTFISLATNCENWIEESLYLMIKIAHVRGIEMDKAIKIITRRKFGKGDANILEKYVPFIVEKWLNDGYTFDDFQYRIFDCDTKYDFYKKYFDDCAHFLIMRGQDDILELANQLKITANELVEKVGAKICSIAMCSDIENIGLDILTKNNVLVSFSKIVGSSCLLQILEDNLDQIVIGILDYLTDEDYIENDLGESVIFFNKYLSIPKVQECFKIIEGLLINKQSMGLFLANSALSKLEKILLQLKLNFYNSIVVKDQFKSLHRYTFFVKFITELLEPDHQGRHFFIRDSIYTLLNVIEKNENCDSIVSASIRFLGAFLAKILPEFSLTFKSFFHDTVNTLKKFYVTRKTISSQCKDILNYLIVRNLDEFEEEIKNLDPFTDSDDFRQIITVHKTVRYGDREPQLEEEIIQFLKHEDKLTKEDGLMNVRKLLASRKNELLQMYNKFSEIRFSEDCEGSLLHRLVCALAQLSHSDNQKVSFEAARCLGELGPANLQIPVLQPEKIMVHEKHSAFEIILGCVISVLSKYLIDFDIEVVKKTSKLFYTILNSKEGRKIADANGDFGFGHINKNNLMPYFPKISTLPSQSPTVKVEYFLAKLEKDDLWCPNGNNSHGRWITTLVSTILETFADNTLLGQFAEVCKVKVDFAECLLPVLFHLLLSLNNDKIAKLIANKMALFFSLHWKFRKECPKEQCIVLDKISVKSMLNVVNYVRLMKKCNKYSELKVNYLKVAKAAEFCSNHFSALYYSELWCQEIIEKIQEENPSYSEKRMTMIDDIYENDDSGCGETLHNILRNTYKSIGDFDALPGCGTSFLLQPKYRVEHYKELGKFDQVIQFYANEASTSGFSSSKELIDSFKNYSLFQIPIICSSSDEAQYECLWRLGQWSHEEKKTQFTTNKVDYEDFDKYQFLSLKALHDKNLSCFQESVNCQLLCVTNHIKSISLESSHNLYPILSDLQALTEMEDFYVSLKSQNVPTLIEKWKTQDTLIRKSDFQYVEPIISQRLVMLCDYLDKQELSAVRDYIVDLSLSFAGWAKDEGCNREASTILGNLKRLSSLNDEVIDKINLLDAQLCWNVDNTVVAKQILNRLCKSTSVRIHAMALKLIGQYKSETDSDNRTAIITDHFLASVKMMSSVHRTPEDTRNIMDTYGQLAVYAYKVYQQLKTYMNSDFFQKKISTMKQAKKTAECLQKQKTKTIDERRAQAIHDRNSNIDDAEIRTAKEESNQFLKISLKYYLLSLVHSDDKNIRVFQVIALFLENRKNAEIYKTIEEYLPKVATYKWIDTLPQLVPHLSGPNDGDFFSERVLEIVEKCAMDHPHHTLPLLLSLVNANKDKEIEKSKTKTITKDSRVDAAGNLLKKLGNKGQSSLINRLMKLSLALIDLAYYKSPDEHNERKKEFDIPRSHKIMAIKNFDDVLVPTCEIPVSVTKGYSNIVGIASFKSSYQIVGGVNKPKKIMCRGTDGKWYSQLVKGQDDLRQDAVMEQVFTIMNDLLSSNKSTKHLRIRTYKIVPLSKRSGILKWADNSMPIGEYLVGTKESKGAHETYRPTDRTPNYCRDKFKGCANFTADFKLQTYKDICKKLKPVFHHFFESQFPQPAVWYERRRAYIQSVATTSMCGYILGIGDRHTSNILIDKITAEVIHIDFGIAFEQGRVLPTPETVPFRLTRDIVDGMGVSGVEGVFRKSCEKTMEVLRQNAQTIMTILEVLLYDPLYAWTVTTAEANKRQTESNDSVREEGSDSSEESTNVSAERALLRLREKLQGTELGYPRSIEHQVGTLIQQAVDPENLCKLYVGWQPYI